MLPDEWVNVSHTDGPLPSSSQAPSIWYADVATPHAKPGGKAGSGPSPRIRTGSSATSTYKHSRLDRPEARLLPAQRSLGDRAFRPWIRLSAVLAVSRRFVVACGINDCGVVAANRVATGLAIHDRRFSAPLAELLVAFGATVGRVVDDVPVQADLSDVVLGEGPAFAHTVFIRPGRWRGVPFRRGRRPTARHS